jgi:hypothetical protein
MDSTKRSNLTHPNLIQELQHSMFMTKKKKPLLKLVHWFEEDALKYGPLIKGSQSKLNQNQFKTLVSLPINRMKTQMDCCPCQ